MTQINLYKIHEDERELFIKSIARKYRICAQKILDGMVHRLFIQYSDEQKDVSWKWAFDLWCFWAFQKKLLMPPSPKFASLQGILLDESDTETGIVSAEAKGRNVDVGMVAVYNSVRREDNRSVIPPSSRKYLIGANADEIGAKLHETALSAVYGKMPRVQFIGDGAPWIENIAALERRIEG